MKKDLKYYMNLNYPVEILKISEDDGGGYSARINLLGKYAFTGDGDTISEAMADLDTIKKILFLKYLENGIAIPEPVEEEEKQYSGRFVLRVPTELHRFLSIEAVKNQTTLNQYCNNLLTRRAVLSSIQEDLAGVKYQISGLYSCIQDINYRISSPTKKISKQVYAVSEFIDPTQQYNWGA